MTETRMIRWFCLSGGVPRNGLQRFRKPLLYPTELQARFVVSLNNKIKTLKGKVGV